MKTCQACGRDFAGRSADCPWCGFNTAPRGGPRSVRSLVEIERDRLQEEAFERELEELGNEFAASLRWNEAVEEPERTHA